MKQPSALNAFRGIHAALLTCSLISEHAFGQTTRTTPSASSTIPTIPSSSSTGPNTPCTSFNPTSPCYSARNPRNPCYSALGEPCSTANTPYPSASPTSLPPAKFAPVIIHALTKDQAKVQIEAKGYSNVSGLRRDRQGNWHGSGEKDGSLRNLTLDRDGNVAEN